MNRRFGVLGVCVVVVGVLGCTPHGGARPPSSASDQAALAEAKRLEGLEDKLYGEGKFQEAVPLMERILVLREQALGPHHPDVAKSLNNLAILYKAQGAYTKALPLLLRALDIREKVLGAMHPDVAESLNGLAVLYHMQGAYMKAESLFIRALDIRERVLGAMHPDVAITLDNLGNLYHAQGAYARAEPLLVRALAIQEKALGPMHLDVAASLADLAVLYKVQGAYAKAELLNLRALDIYEKAPGGVHLDMTSVLNNLASLYLDQGAYAKAEPLYLRALAIRENVLGGMHPDVGASLGSLASCYLKQGMYEKAEPLYLGALAIHEKSLGAIHPYVAIDLNSLASLYDAQGAYAKAEPLYLRSLAIREQTLGAMHPAVARVLHNLGSLYLAQGAYAKVEPLYLRSLDMREKALGPMHPDVAESLAGLAAFYSTQGAYPKAELLYLRALDIYERARGGMHPEVAISLSNLAEVYKAQGVYTKSKPLYLRAIDIYEKVLGGMHPNEVKILNNLTSFYVVQGAYAEAMLPSARAAEIREAQLRLELARLSEPRKRALMRLLQDETDRVVSLHADAMPSSQQALELGITTVLRRKGRVLDSLADNQLNLRAHLTPALRDQLDQLASASAELSTRLRAPRDPRTAAGRASEITALRTRIDALESALNASSAEFRVQSEPVTMAKIQAALPRGAALVEFVRYRRFDARQARPWQEERYVAYVLPSQGPPEWVALGETTPIDMGIDAVLAAMHKGTSASAAKAALQHLDTLVFAPLRGHLNKVSHVILSPDGKLNLVPFEALIDPQGHYELEQRLVSYVTSGRDLLRLDVRRAPRSSATIIAAPDYGPPGSPAFNGLGMFRPLEGTAAEAAELPGYFVQARTLTGDQATKAALAATVGPAVLHLATHGFYATAIAATPTSSARPADPASSASTPFAFSNPLNSRGISVEGNAFSSLLPPSTSDDPTDALDRAGLALAGANVRPDGIVTARELASYDWWGTQLVVLSACETGVGAVPSGEGVYGMRRALVLAGAEAQVVSLWNVSDAATRALMRAFYGELARGTGRAEALRRAKLGLLRQPRFAHPYYWAAFIPAGDWTPLDPHIFQRADPPR